MVQTTVPAEEQEQQLQTRRLKLSAEVCQCERWLARCQHLSLPEEWQGLVRDRAWPIPIQLALFQQQWN